MNKNPSVSQTCAKINQTYNTSDLNGEPQQIQDFFADVSRHMSTTGKGNSMLMELINNNYSKRPRADYISGPFNLTQHVSQKDNMIVYIFGELHGWEDACTEEKTARPIEDYLVNLFRTTNAFIDFYMEIPAFHSKVSNKDKISLDYRTLSPPPAATAPAPLTFQNRIRYKFMKCINTRTRGFSPDCTLIRAHFSDPRESSENYNAAVIGNNTLSFWTLKMQTEKTLKELREVIAANPELLELLEKMKGSEAERISYVINQIKNNSWVRKEIERSYKREALERLIPGIVTGGVKFFPDVPFEADFIYSVSTGKSISPRWRTILTANQWTEEEALRIILYEFRNKIIYMNAPTTDFYTIARLFKRFNVPPGIEQPKQPYNSVLYFGALHSQTCRDILTKFGFEQIAAAGCINRLNKRNYLDQSKLMCPGHAERCLDMRNFPQPFFSKSIEEELREEPQSSGSHDVMSSGSHDVMSSGSYDVILSSGSHDVMSSGSHDVMSSGSHDVMSSGSYDVMSPTRSKLLESAKRSRLSGDGKRETDSRYEKLLRTHEEWMQKDNHEKNVDICAMFGGPTEAGQVKAQQELTIFVDKELPHDLTELNQCCFDQELILWAPTAPGGLGGVLDWTESHLSTDPYVRWLRGTQPGVFQTRRYTMEWAGWTNVLTTDAVLLTLGRLTEECKTVVVQLNLQFGDHAHAALLLLNSAAGKAYVFDPNGNHALFLAYHPGVLEDFVRDLGLELEYLQTPNLNLLLPATWSGVWNLIDPYVSYAYLRGARKKCMTTIAQRGYCKWICLYVTMEIVSGKDASVVIANLTGMSQKERYLMFESFIAYLITLFSLWETDEEL